MKHYDILKEAQKLTDHNATLDAEDILRAYKPEAICITGEDWEQASTETRELLLQVEALHKPLLEAYKEAITHRDYESALYAYQAGVHPPFLFCIDRNLNEEAECIKREAEFIASAREWVAEAKEALRGGSYA